MVQIHKAPPPPPATNISFLDHQWPVSHLFFLYAHARIYIAFIQMLAHYIKCLEPYFVILKYILHIFL